MSIIKYRARTEKVDSLLCIGLDADIQRLPARFQHSETPQFDFNRWIIDITHEYTGAYKPNTAFYEARGERGWRELRLTLDYLREHHPDIYTICDAKRADIGNTNRGYVRAIFDEMGFDAVTLHPYLGKAALMPFLERDDKACIVLCRTSNPDSDELQGLMMGDKPLWQIVAERVRDDWNDHANCMLVVGATYPDEMRRVRQIVGDMPLLVPGVGAQGGDVMQVVVSGQDERGGGLIINSARGIIFAHDPAEAAKSLRDAINQHRIKPDAPPAR